MNSAAEIIETRLQNLEKHLKQENSVLLSTVQGFRKLDQVAYKMGLLEQDTSYAMQIPWWPLISILGTFSSGKSTFINHFLQYKLQRTGNQAVDDKFTVICYSREDSAHSLPGVALDSDPRFPFYQMSDEIEAVAEGEGERIDAYLQLKTCPSERLRGKILIDSPGFDADAQRTSTLRLTDHIIDLSDLVLVFFDARHPEPGAMQDTLTHLVSNTIKRADSGKFLYILNQLDTTAREDNPEEVVAAWQRALGEKGLTAGRFYTIYNPDAAVPIDNESTRQRYEGKRDRDLAEIHGRMQQVEIERAYRIVGALEKTALDIKEKGVPLLEKALGRWRKRVIWGDIILFTLALGSFFVLTRKAGYWDGMSFNPPMLQEYLTPHGILFATVTVGFVILLLIHHIVRKLAVSSLSHWIRKQAKEQDIKGNLVGAFRRSTRPWRSIFRKHPVGWGRGARKRLTQVIQSTDAYVQTLNDGFANPSGEVEPLPKQPSFVDEPEGR